MKRKPTGFSLVEMAIVLVVVGLLLGGLLVPLSTQLEISQRAETEKSLGLIKEALIGFAAINGRLPRPAVSAVKGIEVTSCGVSEANCTGFIPWEVLGISKTDAWGKIFEYSVTPAYANSVITLRTISTKKIKTRNAVGALVSLATPVPAVVWSPGKNNFGVGANGDLFADASDTNVDEESNNNDSVTFISRGYIANTAVIGGEIDDMVTWLSPVVLFNRMIASGVLP